MAWLPPPELAAGVEPELKPPESELELLELEPLELLGAVFLLASVTTMLPSSEAIDTPEGSTRLSSCSA